ncbi:squalene/phytoene synthase family protein [Sodalinema gerasimenkoae]|uniref:squalene/phytoene synthase family protein n=1 Tax=Sodalinema gerasimenkoae TaxID=2862348 RepID=UPI001356F7C7|nr:squalene/phytoene synthase family protein [Sodalinema gerasimenkoae]
MYLDSKIQVWQRPLPASIAPFVGSSEFQALPSDALKDDDNAAWILTLDHPWRHHWLERVRWIRWVDRLAENDLLGGPGCRFAAFCHSWQRLRDQQVIDPQDCWGTWLSAIQQRWFEGEVDSVRIRAWDGYIQASARYHCHDLCLADLPELEALYNGFAGNFFQIFPLLDSHQFEAVRHFGILDQFYNQLRDLAEDAQQGFCYFPQTVLEEFGLERSQFLEGTAVNQPQYRDLMDFWLDDYLPTLIKNAEPFLQAEDLHPSWQLLRYWSLHRYSRIEQVLYESHLDYRQFPRRYWSAVRHDLRNWRWFPC